MDYGLPAGTNIPYGAPGFPAWVYDLAKAFSLSASTYPGHQESDRAEKGYAPNPRRLNRGIDWSGSVPDMQRFAEYLFSIRTKLEQVIWENPDTGKRIGVAGGDDVSNTAYFASDYADHRQHVHSRQSAPIPLPGAANPMPAPLNRPDFNEFPLWSPNNQSRNGAKPIMALLHTQEGNGNALSLAQYLAQPSSGVSYHYTVSQDPKDNGVTVVDCVDTDLASWSVLDYNNRSINLCFAGSSVNWTRQQWMSQSKAIEAAAYLLCADARKYGFSMKVVPPPYTNGTPGFSDHGYVTSRGIGSHTDCGPNFPWTFFKQCVDKWANPSATGTVTPPAPPKPPAPPPPAANIPVPPASYTDRQLLESIWRKLDGLAAQLGAPK